MNFLKGILIGAGAILPGISSGVLCMVMGLYEKLLDSILHFFKNIKHNFQFLFPICLGSLVGIFIFSNVILYCFDTIPIQTKSLFIGLLLGSLLTLVQTNIKKEDIHNHPLSKYISFFVCFALGFFLIILEKHTPFSTEYTPNEFSALFLVLSGFLMSIGIVVPRN